MALHTSIRIAGFSDLSPNQQTEIEKIFRYERFHGSFSTRTGTASANPSLSIKELRMLASSISSAVGDSRVSFHGDGTNFTYTIEFPTTV